MLLPHYTPAKTRLFLLGNALLLLLNWLAQLTHFQAGYLQPVRSGADLLAFTAIFLLLLAANFTKKSTIFAKMLLDYNLVFAIYALILLLFPKVLQTTTLNRNLGGLALVSSLLALSLPYVSRNHLIGIRVPWTYKSPIVWQKTNLLGARLLLATGIISGFFAQLSADWLAYALITGSIFMAAVTIVYSYQLSKSV
ncbi:hypothetical protein FC99_GL002107 [Levilactobacillus koreensis JCM 16448]|uniref:SdpI family protein n=1 Tax=Levilactobacillus koreensis TaxID=637971 RepID=UPI00065F929B|nr:SdpI family protein [Levilactobacillus koreensis]KRK91532.1 hypothetical protein FC99_GL002107 [Levilactobacillus koreensis JCM 16448]